MVRDDRTGHSTPAVNAFRTYENAPENRLAVGFIDRAGLVVLLPESGALLLLSPMPVFPHHWLSMSGLRFSAGLSRTVAWALANRHSPQSASGTIHPFSAVFCLDSSSKPPSRLPIDRTTMVVQCGWTGADFLAIAQYPGLSLQPAGPLNDHYTVNLDGNKKGSGFRSLFYC